MRSCLRRIRFLIGAFPVFVSLLSAAQNGQQMSFSIYDQSTAIPFTRFVTIPVHPGIQVAAEFGLNDRPHGRAFAAAHLGYFYHRHLAQGFYVGGDLGYEARTRFRLSFAGLFGLGYLRTYVTQPEYVFQNGSYVRRPDKGNGRVMPSLSLETGYYFKPTRRSTQLFIRYQSWVEYPYSPGFIELMSHINLHLGVRFTLVQDNTAP
ncbi:MAG: hypothetical protein IPK70_03085 [Flavobacteriales bacterium]|jgi:hypothetical protein|nr:hypothetical protein [Flavobacteriales bacterium]